MLKGNEIDFNAFAEKVMGTKIQPWQSAIVGQLYELKGKFVLYSVRSQDESIKNMVIEYEQSICAHDWNDKMLFISPEKKEMVTACIKCWKRKEIS